METSYMFDRARLLAHIDQWKRKQKRDRYPSSDRELARQSGVSHTAIQNYRKGRDWRGSRVTRMNYNTALTLSSTLDIPISTLLPDLLAASTSDRTAA